MIPVLALIAAYVIGAIPFGYLLVKLKSGDDVRSLGSGNIGATNVLRSKGWTMALTTLLLDIGKGILAVWLAERLTHGALPWMAAAALAVMAGHAFPVFLRWRGGKAVATFVGAFGYLTPVPLLSTLIVFVAIVAVTRYISMGSIVAAGCFPLAVLLIEHPPQPLMTAAIAAGAFIVFRHRANVQRIRAGNEHVFSLGSRGS